MAWWLAIALAQAPAPPEATLTPTPDPPRRARPFGVGAAWVASAVDHRVGVHLELQPGFRPHRHVGAQWLAAVGVTSPEHTVATVAWGTRAAGTLADAIRDVDAWRRRGEGTDTEGLRFTGQVVATTGLGMAFVAVPLVYAVSPLMAAGSAVTGPTLSVHPGSGESFYVEAGGGAMLYRDPTFGGVGVGYGPILGAGLQLGPRRVGARVLLSPPGAHTGTKGTSPWLASTGVFIGL
jgi:hypothetical protein